ncbi:MAG: PEP-utilizing enzyme [Dehalococcoidia bacterium]
MQAIGTGFNVFKNGKVEGIIKKVEKPKDVSSLFINSRNQLNKFIIVSTSGTATFVAPMLTGGVKGMIALTGAPESHLGLLLREYKIPSIMGFQLDNIKFEDIKEGATLVMDCEDERVGKAYIK